MRPRTRLLVVFATVPVVAFTLVGGYLGQAVAREDAYRHLRVFEDVVSLIADNYVEAVDLDDVMTGALRGLSSGLDADSAYLTPDEVRRIEAGEPLPEAGIGVTVISQFYLQIVGVRDGSPAAEAGFQPGDYIQAIGDQATRMMSSVAGTRALRGAPGSTVRLSLVRGNRVDPFEVELVRQIPQGTNVTFRQLESGIGLVRVAHFDAGVTDEIQAAVSQLTDRGADRIMVDVRNAAGGSYEEGISAARLFVPSGTLLLRREQGEQEVTIEGTAGAAAISNPLVVLMNAGTAHAAELFAASLSGVGRADTVGQQSAGRASLQKLVKLPDGSGLWLSWARYVRADGEPIHRAGLEPTVAVDVQTVEMGEPLPPGDPVLDRAIEHFQAVQVASRDRRVAQLVRAPA